MGVDCVVCGVWCIMLYGVWCTVRGVVQCGAMRCGAVRLGVVWCGGKGLDGGGGCVWDEVESLGLLILSVGLDLGSGNDPHTRTSLGVWCWVGRR